MLSTLRGKFMLVYVGLVLLAALVGLVGFWNLYRLEQSVDDLMTANYKSIDAVYHMMESIERQDSGVLTYLSIDKTRGIDLFTRNGNDFAHSFVTVQGNITEKGERDLVEQINTDYTQYSKTIYLLQDLERPKDAQEYYSQTVLPLFEKLKDDCWQVIRLNEQAMFTSKQKTMDSAKDSMALLLILSFSFMVVGYFISRYFIFRFLKPIRQLSESISQVREGALNQQLDVVTDDEAGKLVTEFNSMTRRLQSYEQSSLGTLMAERNKSVAIVRSITDPLIVLDSGWRILLVNTACSTFFNLDEGNVLGRHFLEAIHDGDLFQQIENLVSNPADIHGKIISLKREEEYFFKLTATKVYDPENRNSGIIVAFQNVTGLKQLEKVKENFLSAISHELKTPLTSIMMAGSLLQEHSIGDLNEDQKNAVDAIQEESDRLLSLVNELLELMRIESGSDVYHLESCSIQTIVEASVHSFFDAARAKDVQITADIPNDLPEITADKDKLRWVMNNLIGNALKHSAVGGTISIFAGNDEEPVTVSVQDTGTGIPPEYIDQVFDRYIQIESEELSVRGTGLGLATSRDIILWHGGDIQVKSELNVGSTFTFCLPIRTERGAQ